jgi:hypothetical protein
MKTITHFLLALCAAGSLQASETANEVAVTVIQKYFSSSPDVKTEEKKGDGSDIQRRLNKIMTSYEVSDEARLCYAITLIDDKIRISHLLKSSIAPIPHEKELLAMRKTMLEQLNALERTQEIDKAVIQDAYKWRHERHLRYREKMRQLHAQGVRPPKDSPFIGSWGKEDNWMYAFLADGTMSITKPTGEVMRGTWVHEKDAADPTSTAVYRIDDYATQLWIDKDGDLCVSSGDTWAKYPPNSQKPAKRDNGGDKAEQAGAGQPATKPADKVPANDQPSPPTSKASPP